MSGYNSPLEGVGVKFSIEPISNGFIVKSFSWSKTFKDKDVFCTTWKEACATLKKLLEEQL